MRSSMQRQRSSNDGAFKANAGISGDVQMQSFSEGLPPPPPVSHTWKRIDRWLEDNYEELQENLCEGCTQNDLNELEHELDCTLPQDVRESLQIHDGQERGGRPTGVVFGCMLLDCEEIVQEWHNWRKVNEDGRTTRTTAPKPELAPRSCGQAGLATSERHPKAYVHPAWIPLARDWGGNNICVDLAPGPTGKWGQVIIFGRDYDCKYVVSRSWAAFLAQVADDMSTDRWWIEEETHELKLREFKQPGVEPAYLDILRWRADQKYGRKQGPKRRPGQGLRINSNVSAQMNGFSPYGSPNVGNDERGRSPSRFNGKQPVTSSPRMNVSSPLARVTEELPSSVKVHDYANARSHAAKLEKLVSIDSPLPPDNTMDSVLEHEDPRKKTSLDGSASSEQSSAKDSKMDASPAGGNDKDGPNAAGAGEMKTVEI
ncbi:Cell wall assembly regulator [Taxawa tesnikishii (nom. ined.)]|nr:Cell wall assembly regulator [Dothideales sp. JES 119]